MQSEIQKINELGFITKGIYQTFPPSNFIYHIEDLTPLLINNKPKVIGEGRFSTVYLYKHKINGTLFALKKISIQKILESENDINIIQREINIHSRIQHENIVQFYSYNKGVNEVNILLEYCNNGSIFELINKNGFEEIRTYKYFSQVVNAVYFLHKNNLVHRDIKPENILLSGDKIKLCDFGWCCETNINNRKSFCGTFEYMAPEIIKDIPYGKPVDIWALGILLYELYFGVSPFSSNKENEEQTKEVINNIMQKKLFFNKKSISYDMKDLIIHMLEFDVNYRYTIDEVISHPWFKKCKEKIKSCDLNSNSNYNNINNYENIKTSVSKVTKITRSPIESLPYNFQKGLYRTNSFSLEKYNFPMNNFEIQNKNKKNYISNKSLNFKNINDISINPILNKIDNEEDGFSPFMKNGSINISVALPDKNEENINKKINAKMNNNLNRNYLYINRKEYNTENNFNSNQFNNNNFYPMDSLIGENQKRNFGNSNVINPSRISIIKLNDNNINQTIKNTGIKNNHIKTNPFYNTNNNNIINYNFYQINNNNQFNNIFY